jgi:hypothetical protein
MRPRAIIAAAPVGQQGPPARTARGSLLLTTGDGLHRP